MRCWLHCIVDFQIFPEMFDAAVTCCTTWSSFFGFWNTIINCTLNSPASICYLLSAYNAGSALGSYLSFGYGRAGNSHHQRIHASVLVASVISVPSVVDADVALQLCLLFLCAAIICFIAAAVFVFVVILVFLLLLLLLLLVSLTLLVLPRKNRLLCCW